MIHYKVKLYKYDVCPSPHAGQWKLGHQQVGQTENWISRNEIFKTMTEHILKDLRKNYHLREILRMLA
jgi:hypothetical protein